MYTPSPHHAVANSSSLVPGSFSQLAKSALWGICLNLKEHVIATHQELAILRRCATLACDKPNQVIHVVAADKTKHTTFIVRTLMHFGVSCGQINVRSSSQDKLAPEGIWIFVEKRHPVC